MPLTETLRKLPLRDARPTLDAMRNDIDRAVGQLDRIARGDGCSIEAGMTALKILLDLIGADDVEGLPLRRAIEKVRARLHGRCRCGCDCDCERRDEA